MKQLLKAVKSLTFAFLIGSLLTTAAYAQHSDNYHQSPPDQNSPPRSPQLRFLDRLDLSEQQQEQIMTLFENHHQQMETYRESIKVLRDDLKELLNNLENPQTIKSKIMDMNQLEGEIKVLQVDLIFNVINILTEEQVDQLPDNFLMRFLQPQSNRPNQPNQNQSPHNQNQRPSNQRNSRPDF
jgi:Spy/CpxP family protein refolding chaperone